MKKPPRRTAERIESTALRLFNRFGEPNVATTLIAADMGISPGNLFYHFPSKELLVNRLFDAFESRLFNVLNAATDVQDMEHAWFFMHSVFELIWQHRFIYRDLNDLLSKNRHLESRAKEVMRRQQQAFEHLLHGLQAHGCLVTDSTETHGCPVHMVVVLTWWLSYEYVQNPRQAMEDDQANQCALRGAQQVLGLLLPHLKPAPKAQLQSLMTVYG